MVKSNPDAPIKATIMVEGKIVKGGVNAPPTTSKPSVDPHGSKILAKSEFQTEDFNKALRSLKQGMFILAELDAADAGAAISSKLIDVLDNVAACKPKLAINDMWGCCYVIYKILYESFSITTKKTSNRAIAASCAFDDGNFEEAYHQYVKACYDITKDTGFETLFMEAQ